MKTNILVQYQGGGYSGCIWEWNYFYIDKQGTFHDIASSGCDGVDNIDKANELLEQDKSHTYIYDMGKENDIKTFGAESHAAHVSGVLQWFEDNMPDVGFFAVCSACGCEIDSCDDMVTEGDRLFCYECYSIGQCPCCDYYVGDENIVGCNSDEHHGHGYICTECKEYHDDEREIEQLEDLRWQSFCTGKPDMFSDVLREIWV